MTTTVGSVARVMSGHHFRERLIPSPEGNFAVIQMKDVADTDIAPNPLFARVQLTNVLAGGVIQDGDIVLRSRGESYSAVVARGAFERTVIAAPLTLLRPDTSMVLAGYLAWFINHPLTQAKLAGVATGTYVRTVSKGELVALPLPVPPISRQQKIVEFAAFAAAEQSLLEKISASRRRLAERVLWQYAQDAR